MSVPNPASTDWVALWDLNGGVKLDYKGSWVAGSYVDGDVVVHQGGTYMCVRPTSAAPVPWPLASGSASYGTSPPANPVDGQIWVYPHTSGGAWQFRYNAASPSSYKWDFIGGPPIFNQIGAVVTIPSAGAWHLTASPIAFDPPRAGYYYVETSAQMGGSAATGSFGQLALASNVSTPQSSPQAFSHVANGMHTFSHAAVLSGVAAFSGGGYIAACYWISVANINFANRTLAVTPVRVS